MREIKFELIYDNGEPPRVVNIQELIALDREEGEHLFADIRQYTGLKDKNGKEIYEGDIVNCRMFSGWSEETNFKNFKVSWDEERYSYRIGNEDLWILGTPIHEPEVIGNIYENPELLST